MPGTDTTATLPRGNRRLQTLSPSADREALLAALAADGAAIVADVLPPDVVSQAHDEVMPFLERTPAGHDEFSGAHTQRTGALVARAPVSRDLVMHPAILPLARAFLRPFSKRIVLHLTQAIYIHPGAEAQALHRDRFAWGTHLPRSIEPQFNTIWALTDFTASNGATRVVPGSHTWDWEREAAAEEQTQAVMAAGSVLIYSGSVLHGGGANDSDASRLGHNITYCLAWLRQEENQYLSCPPHIARDLDPDLQALLGYTMGSYALGYFYDPDFDPSSPHGTAGAQAPEKALATTKNQK